MAGRYYYRPAMAQEDPLGVGIGRGLAALGAGVADRRQRKQQDADRQRKQTQEDALFDIELAGMGGGRGYAPVMRTGGGSTLDMPGGAERGPSVFRDPATFMSPDSAPPASPLLDPSAWLAGPGPEPGGPGLRFQPSGLEAPTSHVPLTMEDPRFLQMGSEDTPFYIQDPEYRATHAADTAFTRQRREAALTREDAAGASADRVNRIAAALKGRDPTMSDEEAFGTARLLVEGNASYSALNDRETFSPRLGPEGYVNFGNRGTVQPTDIGLPPSESAAGRGVTPTSEFTQQASLARQMLSELNWIDRQKLAYPDMTGAEVGMARQRIFDRYGMDETMARALVMRSGLSGGEEDTGETDMSTPPPPAGAPPRGAAPTGRTPPGGTTQPPTDEEALNAAEVSGIITKLAKIPRGEWMDQLKAAGFTERQINQVLGGRQ